MRALLPVQLNGFPSPLAWKTQLFPSLPAFKYFVFGWRAAAQLR